MSQQSQRVKHLILFYAVFDHRFCNFFNPTTMDKTEGQLVAGILSFVLLESAGGRQTYETYERMN